MPMMGMVPFMTEGKIMIELTEHSVEWEAKKGYSSLKLSRAPHHYSPDGIAYITASGNGKEDAEIELPLHVLMKISYRHFHGLPLNVHYKCPEYPSEYHFDVQEKKGESDPFNEDGGPVGKKVYCSIRSRSGGVRTGMFIVRKDVLMELVNGYLKKRFDTHSPGE